MTTSRAVHCFATLLFLSVASAAVAQDASPVLRFIDAEAVAVVRLRIDKLDTDQAVAAVGRIAGAGSVASAEQRQLIEQSARTVLQPIDSLRRAGARDLFVVLSLADISPQGGPFAVLTTAPGADAKGLAQRLESLVESLLGFPPDVAIEPVGDAVLIGRKATLQRLHREPMRPRSDAQAALAGDDAPLQAVLLLSADQRRAIREMLPEWPALLGGGSTAPLSEGFSWARVSLELKPELKVQLLIETRDSRSAQALHAMMGRLWTAVKRRPELRTLGIDVEKLLSAVRLTQDGSRLRAEFKESDAPIVAAVLASPVLQARESARRGQCVNNLKQLALAAHNYHDTHNTFPPQALRDANGKKLLSWRVLLLPYLEQGGLYEQFHLDEPWDSEHNRKLIEKMPAVFACPSADLTKRGMTTYLAPVGKGTVFGGKEGTSIRAITDGTSATILFVEVDPQHAVIWTKPDDLAIDWDNVRRGLAKHHSGGFNAVFCDGAVHFLSGEVPVETLKRLLQMNDGHPVKIP